MFKNCFISLAFSIHYNLNSIEHINLRAKLPCCPTESDRNRDDIPIYDIMRFKRSLFCSMAFTYDYMQNKKN